MMMKQPFLHGAVLKVTREDTLDDIRAHFTQMKDNGLNSVVLWPPAFWWEEKTDLYPFKTGRDILEIAKECDIRVIMELAGQLHICEYIPDFQMKDEYYPVDKDGNRIWCYEAFGYLNYFHPEVDALIAEHFRKTVEAYKDCEALFAYDIFNETLAGSYDEYTMEQFRIWLKAKYGTIENLNAVWERTYTDFSQVDYTPWKWMSIMPEADFKLFQRAITPIILKRWGEIIREVDPNHPLLADNVYSSAADPSAYNRDDFALAEVVDEIGISFYPKVVPGCIEPTKRWQIFDGFYASSKRKGFYVSEMQTHTQAVFNPNTHVPPAELRLWCLEAVAAGCKSLIYWMWRPFDKGLQTLGRGLVDYKNRSTPRLEMVKDLSSLLKEAGPLTPVKSKVGVVYDRLCDVYQKCYTVNYPVDQDIYHHSLFGAYKAFMDAGVKADVITFDEIDNYEVVLLSNHIVLSKEDATRLQKYVEGGGKLICDGKMGIVDETSMLHKNIPGGDFQPCIGAEYMDTDSEHLQFSYNGANYDAFYGRDLLRVTDGTVLGTFEDGHPAVISKKLGKGEVLTINTYLWYGYYMANTNADKFARMLIDAYNLLTVSASDGLTVRICESETAYYAFLFNYTNEVATGHLTAYGFDEDVTVAANDAVVLHRFK